MKRVPTNFKRWAPQRVKREHHRPPFSIREVIPLWASPTLRKGSRRTRRLKLSFMVSLVCRTGSVSPFTSLCEIKAQLPFSPWKALCLLCLFPSHPVCKNHFGGFDEKKNGEGSYIKHSQGTEDVHVRETQWPLEVRKELEMSWKSLK